MKICLISSHGGHLRELLNATSEVKGDKYVVTYRTRHTEDILREQRHYFIIDPHKSVLKYLLNAVQALRHILKERPELVISTGAGIAVPTALWAKSLLQAKVIFIESAANVVNPSKTGKFLYRYSDLFLIQWQGLQSHYPKARYCGLV